MRHTPKIYRHNSPFGSLIDGFLNKSIGELVGSDYSMTIPSVNIVDENDHYRIDLAAPGLNKEDFNLRVENATLIISVKKEEQSTSEEKGKYTRKEYSYNAFTRSFQLPENADENKISATYNNGILSISVAKMEEKSNSTKKIDII